MNKSELANLLWDKVRNNGDLLFYIIEEYINTLETLGDSKLDELEDFLVNNFGDD